MWRDTVAKKELILKFKSAQKDTKPTQAQYFNKDAERRVHDLQQNEKRIHFKLPNTHATTTRKNSIGSQSPERYQGKSQSSLSRSPNAASSMHGADKIMPV